jgi:hypothetical protein
MEGNLYSILGLEQDASTDNVFEAYRSLARECHPDMNPDDSSATKRFKEIQHAFEVLSDPVKRAEYDATIGPAVRWQYDPKVEKLVINPLPKRRWRKDIILTARIWSPAISLLVLGLFSTPILYLLWLDNYMNIFDNYFIYVTITMNIFVILGAISMLTFRGYFLALVGSVIAMFLFWMPCCLSLPIGVWAFVVLSNPDIKKAFRW